MADPRKEAELRDREAKLEERETILLNREADLYARFSQNNEQSITRIEKKADKIMQQIKGVKRWST